MKNILRLFLLLGAFTIGFSTTYAAEETRSSIEEREGALPSDAPDYVYEKPTPDKLALLYWALSKLDINNDDYINNFMLITECDIYRQYFSDEFEWKGIMAAARAHIEANKKNFPLRFQFTQPLKLGEYNLQRKRFDILDDYKINVVRRFEVLSTEYRDEICGVKGNAAIPGYPRGLIVELSRPLNLTSVPVEPAVANEYIKKHINPDDGRGQITKENLYQDRDAYIVMKIKAFAYQDEKRTGSGFMLAEVLAVLEGYEIYADKEKKQLLYAKYFRKRKRPDGTKPAETDEGAAPADAAESSPAPAEAEPQPTSTVPEKPVETIPD